MDFWSGQGANHSDTSRYREDLQRSPGRKDAVLSAGRRTARDEGGWGQGWPCIPGSKSSPRLKGLAPAPALFFWGAEMAYPQLQARRRTMAGRERVGRAAVRAPQVPLLLTTRRRCRTQRLIDPCSCLATPTSRTG